MKNIGAVPFKVPKTYHGPELNLKKIFIFQNKTIFIQFHFLSALQSGKLVLKLFTSIKEVADDQDSMVIILIDEVESIAYARDSVSAQEPSDSLRVVNAVLTQLDQLRKYPNVLVLTTSNLSNTIDLAFVDRADLKQYVDFPSQVAIYHIFRSAIDELIKVMLAKELNTRLYSFSLVKIK